MKNSTITLPIFALPIFLLPGGITRLRIFEPRYLKMVKIASKGQGFVLWLNIATPETTNLNWGSWVQIINFDQGKDGVLEIDVKCTALVEILSRYQDEDNLSFGLMSEMPHWSQDAEIQASTNSLSRSLNAVFENNLMLNSLYTDKPTSNANWVVARWLEFLPVELAIKTSFVKGHNYEDAKRFVQTIVLK